MPVCMICPRACAIQEGRRGACGARACIDGKIVCENYGMLTAVALDPIEKKPLASFRPCTNVLSVGSYGCNLRCPWCQNADIAWAKSEQVATRYLTPEQLVRQALELEGRGCIGIAYTYNEPLISFEFVYDTALLAHDAGLANILVSNGFATSDTIRLLGPLIDAANIDLKGWSDELYRQIGGDVETVKATIAYLIEIGCHVEVTTLVIPGLNDEPDDIAAMATWLSELDPSLTYHLTRYFPCHKMAVPPTPRATLERCMTAASRYLSDVRLGNV